MDWRGRVSVRSQGQTKINIRLVIAFRSSVPTTREASDATSEDVQTLILELWFRLAAVTLDTLRMFLEDGTLVFFIRSLSPSLLRVK